MEDQKPKFKPFPKIRKKGGNNRTYVGYDLDKIHDLYINGSGYSWNEFCKEYEFNPTLYQQIWRKGSKFSQWKVDWQKRRMELTDEELTPKLYGTAKSLINKKILFIDDWYKTSIMMKKIFDASVTSLHNRMAMELRDPLVASGTKQPIFSISIDEINSLASAALKIQQLHSNAMLDLDDDAKDRMKQIADQVADEAEDATEITVSPMGKELSTPEMTNLMASYFDQYQAPEPPKILEAPPSEENKV